MAGAPTSTPINLLFILYKFESHELCESPAKTKVDCDFSKDA